MAKKHYIYFVISLIVTIISMSQGYSMIIPDDTDMTPILTDTIPVKERAGNFINDPKKNPFDITPSVVEQTVEYDPESGNYIIYEKIGDEYYRNPNYMTFGEYLQWKTKKDEQQYFRKLAGIKTGFKSKLGKIDPLSRIDFKKNLIDRLFGGTDISISPQGNIDLIIGFIYNKNDNPFIPETSRGRPILDFDMDIRMSVDGKIGDKMNLGFNYDTQATFDFDKKMKLEYDSEQFSEDDIIKKIEAGNVSFPLRSTLIQGVESLFGLKTDLQFGHLKISAIASEQRSKKKNLRVQNGAVEQEFEIRPDEYDENRHFFLSHYHRDRYEEALENLPQIKGLAEISEIEVWVEITRNQSAYQQRKIVGIADLGEGDIDNYMNPASLFPPVNPDRDVDGRILPDNNANPLYRKLLLDDDTRNHSGNLKGPSYQLTDVKEFAKFEGRKLNPNEYTYHSKLGILSLNQRLRSDQELAVGYTYTYRDSVYHIGDPIVGGVTSNVDMMNNPQPKNVKYMKLLKSSRPYAATRVTEKASPLWDLMMKNVYAIGTAQLNQDGFQFDVFYENNVSSGTNKAGSLVRFLPEPEFEFDQLLGLFNLDNLNTRLDPQQDGVFDFIPGITVIPRTGTIIFPKLEPFGSGLDTLFKGNQTFIDKYAFGELYKFTKTNTENYLHKNRFVMKGKFKSNFSSEISLGAFNVPQGSVTVTAGGVQLIEGVDYEINYGLGQVKIINSSYLSSGQPINIQFEDNASFSTQQKNMFGLRAEYEINKKMNIGATYLRLFEKPYSEKVNLGDDPINNRVFGLDFNYGDEAPFITRMLDKLPFYSTKQTSNINFSTEMAVLKPGHSSAIDLNKEDGGLVSIDDFEGATSKISLSSYSINNWKLASTPSSRIEANLTDNLAYGANRALINWFGSYNRTGAITADNNDSYTRDLKQRDLFNREIATNDPSGQKLYTLSMSYYPEERGPYNFDEPNGLGIYTSGVDVTENGIKLKDPETRWGGIMRSFQNTDFEAINVEFLEFWLLDPYTTRTDGYTHVEGESGRLVFNLGDISEDILKDEQQFFENSVSTNPNTANDIIKTAWGEVPLFAPISKGFDKTDQEKQDLGLDGLDDNGEVEYFADYIAAIKGANPNYSEIDDDPCNDNFISVDDDSYGPGVGLIEKYKRWNGPQGNSELRTGSDSRLPGNPQADSEDLNDNKSLEDSESYYEYSIPLNEENGKLNIGLDGIKKYITQTKIVNVEGRSANHPQGSTETWYRLRIPLAQGVSVNEIEGFSSIQFLRMYMEGFKTPKILRFAELELVRNQWKRSKHIFPLGAKDFTFSVDQVTKFDNEGKKPFGYVIPRGVKTEKLYSTIGTTNQDEKSMVLDVCGMGKGGEASIYKLSRMDLRQFKRMQLFVHGETESDSNKYVIFLKLGKDFTENYYEYELPLVMSELNDGRNAQERVWRMENKFDFPLSIFTELKKIRNRSSIDTLLDVENVSGGVARIKGNPSLGYIKGIQIGIRKVTGPVVLPSGDNNICAEVWVNELRVSGFKEKGGLAATAKLDVQLADLGTFSAISNYSSVGWGALDQKLDERQKEEILDYSLATNLQLGKLLPKQAKLSIPFYAQYSQSFSTPQYDPYDLDLTVDEKIASIDSEEEKQEVRDRAQDKTTIKTFNFNNVKRQKKSKGKPMPWDISNISLSYSYTKMNHTDPLLRIDESIDERGGLDYTYTRKVKYIKPFKFIKSKSLKFISNINFNLIPNSFTFANQLKRFHSRKEYRLPTDIAFAFDDKHFDWNRKYILKWNLMKDLKMSFNAENNAIIDELRQTGIKRRAVDREWVDERGNNTRNGKIYEAGDEDKYWKDNFMHAGRNKSYNHRLKLDYTLPLKSIPFLSFLKVKAGYQSNYTWDASALNIEHLGNNISNGQVRNVNADLNFTRFYNKSKYLKKIQSKSKAKKKDKKDSKSNKSPKKSKDKKGKGKKSKKNKNRQPSLAERLLIRPLLLVRTVKLTYKEDLGTTIPGIRKDRNPEFFGLANKFTAPGWDFVAGLQPDLDKFYSNAVSNDWISNSVEQNQNTLQTKRQNIDAKITLEPIPSFKINVNFKKTYTNSHSRLFSNIDVDQDDYRHSARIDMGSFETTYFTLNTLFGGQAFNIEDNKKRINRVFQTAKDNRVIISRRLEDRNIEIAKNNNTIYIPGEHVDNSNYTKGYGDVSNEVLIPAFLAAYQGKSANDVELNLENDLSRWDYIPKPNWTVKYDGLSKLRWFKDIFKSFSLSHGYKSLMKVSNFRTSLDYRSDNPFGKINELNNNYYSRIEIPALRIQESFNPIIGIDIQTKSGMKLNFEYNKKRDLALETTTSRLQEGNTTELVFGFGYVAKNVDIPFLTRSKKKSKKKGKLGSLLDRRKKKEEEKEAADAAGKKKKRKKNVTDTRGNDLTMNFDFSIRDDVRYVHEYSLTEARADRGSKTISLSPNIEYDIHKNLSLVMYFDYRKTIPYLTSSYTQTNMKGGFKVRFKLN